MGCRALIFYSKRVLLVSKQQTHVELFTENYQYHVLENIALPYPHPYEL